MIVYNRAAFARENVGDARRGHPDFDLHDYPPGVGLSSSITR
jgi:hypothetical protein